MRPINALWGIVLLVSAAAFQARADGGAPLITEAIKPDPTLACLGLTPELDKRFRTWRSWELRMRYPQCFDTGSDIHVSDKAAAAILFTGLGQLAGRCHRPNFNDALPWLYAAELEAYSDCLETVLTIRRPPPAP